jgi:hypothetical protein
MGKSSPAPPAAPDPVATANAQGAANKDAAIAGAELSMIGQNTPYGTLAYSQTGTSEKGNPLYTATTELTPDQQNLLNMQTTGQLNLGQLGLDQLGRIQTSVADPFSYEGLPEAPIADDAYRASVEDALFQRLNPQFDRDQAALETQLANQGIAPGSQAYNEAVDAMNRAKTDARLAVTAQGGQEMGRLFGLQQSARQQGIQERAYSRDRPLSEYSAFMSGSQPTMPVFGNTPTSNVQPADITGATYASYQGNLSNYNQQMQANNATKGGLFGLGSAALGGWAYKGFPGMAALAASDRRVKENVIQIGTRPDGLNVYAFTYIGDSVPHVGLMADEVEKVYPSAVIEIGGIKHVDYAQTGG